MSDSYRQILSVYTEPTALQTIGPQNKYTTTMIRMTAIVSKRCHGAVAVMVTETLHDSARQKLIIHTDN